MELLLILSALLSALTGVISGGRAPELASHQTAVAVRTAIEVVATMAATQRPAAARPTLRTLAARSVPRAAAPAFAIPLYASRRRE